MTHARRLPDFWGGGTGCGHHGEQPGGFRTRLAAAGAAFTAVSRTISLTSELVTGKHATIDATNLSGGLVASGSGAARILRVAAGGDLTVKRVALTGGIKLSGGDVEAISGEEPRFSAPSPFPARSAAVASK